MAQTECHSSFVTFRISQQLSFTEMCILQEPDIIHDPIELPPPILLMTSCINSPRLNSNLIQNRRQNQLIQRRMSRLVNLRTDVTSISNMVHSEMFQFVVQHKLKSFIFIKELCKSLAKPLSRFKHVFEVSLEESSDG